MGDLLHKVTQTLTLDPIAKSLDNKAAAASLPKQGAAPPPYNPNNNPGTHLIPAPGGVLQGPTTGAPPGGSPNGYTPNFWQGQSSPPGGAPVGQPQVGGPQRTTQPIVGTPALAQQMRVANQLRRNRYLP